jgi:hypothetical protein
VKEREDGWGKPSTDVKPSVEKVNGTSSSSKRLEPIKIPTGPRGSGKQTNGSPPAHSPPLPSSNAFVAPSRPKSQPQSLFAKAHHDISISSKRAPRSSATDPPDLIRRPGDILEKRKSKEEEEEEEGARKKREAKFGRGSPEGGRRELAIKGSSNSASNGLKREKGEERESNERDSKRRRS